jgi:hypothetical protein
VSSQRRRERSLAQAGDVGGDDVDPGLFFDDRGPSRRGLWTGPSFRQEAARSIHRKRVPEITFDVRLAGAVDHE